MDVLIVPAADMKDRQVRFLERAVPGSLCLDGAWTEQRSAAAHETLVLGRMGRRPRVVIGVCSGAPLAIVLAERFGSESLILVSAPSRLQDIKPGFSVALLLAGVVPEPVARVTGRLVYLIVNRLTKGRMKVPRLWLSWSRNQRIARNFLGLSVREPTAVRFVRIMGRRDPFFYGSDCRNTTLLEGGHFLLRDSPLALVRVCPEIGDFRNAQI